jgi:MFS family permease
MLGVVSLFTDLSSEMIYPLLPVFLTSVLGASTVELGLIEGFAEATASSLKVVSGVWTDHVRRRKPLIVFGYCISGFFRPLIGIAQSWPFVLALRFFDRVGKGIRSSPRDALIADITTKEQRGAAYGVHRAMDHAGAVVGPLVAAALLLLPGMGLRNVFLVAAIPALITLGVLVFGVKEELVEVQAVGPKRFTLFQDWRHLGHEFKVFLITLIVFTLGNSTDAFVLVKLSKAGVSTGAIALLWSLHHVVKMISTYYGGKFADKRRRRSIIASGWLYYAAIYLAFGFFESQTTLIAVFLIYGIYFGAVEPAERAMVADLAPENFRGTAFGFFHFTIGVGALPASLLFGLVWQTWGAAAAFTMGAVLAIIASGLLFFIPPPRG